MKTNDLDYALPEELIAQTPLAERDASRMLHIERATGTISHRMFRDCISLLQPGDLLVANNTRVTAIRLFGKKSTGGNVEALLLRETAPGEYLCLLRPAKRLKPGSPIVFEGGLTASVVREEDGGQRVIRFDDSPGWKERLQDVSLAPLPPYIQTPLADQTRYQTVYAGPGGSSAAPTAGLHFTDSILEALVQKGVSRADVTLHVGLDTFRPIQTERVEDHTMTGEICEIPPETAEAVGKCRGRIVAVGTTTVRTLETFATGKKTVASGKTTSKLFITPGYEFQIVDGMFTNFHMPRTSMLLMISALAGANPVRSAYKQAVQERYRFLSFGDSMLIL